MREFEEIGKRQVTVCSSFRRELDAGKGICCSDYVPANFVHRSSRKTGADAGRGSAGQPTPRHQLGRMDKTRWQTLSRNDSVAIGERTRPPRRRRGQGVDGGWASRVQESAPPAILPRPGARTGWRVRAAAGCPAGRRTRHARRVCSPFPNCIVPAKTTSLALA